MALVTAESEAAALNAAPAVRTYLAITKLGFVEKSTSAKYRDGVRALLARRI